MVKKTIEFFLNKEPFKLKIKSCNFFEKIRGLMFTRRENAEALLFEFKNPEKIKIHSFFVFFPFLAIWLDDKNQVIDVKKVDKVKFSIFPSRNFSKLIEIPFNKKYNETLKKVFIDDISKKFKY